MAKIYISSTYEDLREYRETVYRALHKLSGHEIRAMEDYVATDMRPLDKCLADVEWCDVYVGVFAWRYGFIPAKDNPQKKSITEREFRKAGECGKERLLYLLDENADWKRSFMDCATPAGGAEIDQLRKELKDAFTINFFRNPFELANFVTTGITEWEKRLKPHPAAELEPEAAASSQYQVREITFSALLCYSPLDQEKVQAWRHQLEIRELKVLPSVKTLFAVDEPSIQDVEKELTQCHTALVTISPASLDQLKPRADTIRRILLMMRDRLGYAGGVLAGVKAQNLPAGWAFTETFEIPDPADFAMPAGECVTGRVVQALQRRLPGSMMRTVGIPIVIVAMTNTECRQLLEHPAVIGDRLGLETMAQFKELCDGLAKQGVAWNERYSVQREDWCPFSANGSTVTGIVSSIASDLNSRDIARLRQRFIKVQQYPFEGLKDPLMRRIYRDVAQTGAIVIVDEVSMFHPDLRDAFLSSQFFSSQQAAIVTISPFDPGRFAINQVLEQETRSKLRVAFDRFEYDYDPQCEFAVADERHFKRWLHISLPETMKNLREARPDPTRLQQFAGEVGGTHVKRGIVDQIWPGGGRA
jgi:hypothetical protein